MLKNKDIEVLKDELLKVNNDFLIRGLNVDKSIFIRDVKIHLNDNKKIRFISYKDGNISSFIDVEISTITGFRINYNSMTGYEFFIQFNNKILNFRAV